MSSQAPRNQAAGRHASNSHNLTSSNSTLNTFLGGRQRSWMTSGITAIPSNDFQNSQHPVTPQTSTQQHGVPLQPAHSPLNPITSSHPSPQYPLPPIGSEPTRPLSTSSSPLVANLLPQASNSVLQPSHDTVLPSPAPSEDSRFQFHSPASPDFVQPAAQQVDLSESDLQEYSSRGSERNPKRQRMSASDPSRVGNQLHRPSSIPIIDSTGVQTSTPTPISQGSVNPSLRYFLRSIDDYVRSRGGFAALQGTHELERLKLLQTACVKEDCFYLALHQIFALKDWAPASLVKSLPMSPSHVLGFNVVGQCLMAHTNFAPDAIRWFSQFPAPIEKLLVDSPLYQTATTQVMTCLPLLGKNWNEVQERSRPRGFPPLVDELIQDFKILSPLFQRIAFTCIYRNVWGNGTNAISQRLESLFIADSNASAERAQLATMGRAPLVPAEDSHQQIIGEYLQLDLANFRLRRSIPQGENHLSQSPNPRHSMVNSLPVGVPPGRAVPSTRTPPIMTGPPTTPAAHIASPVYNTSPTSYQWSTSPTAGPASSMPYEYEAQTQAQAYPPNNLTYPAQIDIQIQQPPRRRGRPPRRPLPTGLQRQSINQSQRTNNLPLVNVYPNAVTQIPQIQYHPRNAPHPPHFRQTPPHYVPDRAISGTPANLFLPSVAFVNNNTQGPPNPDTRALHQAHLRTPELQKMDLKGMVSPKMKLYQYISGFALAPQYLGPTRSSFEYHFTIEIPEFQRKAIDVANGDTNTRVVADNNLFWRLRCVRLALSDTINESMWSIADCFWPSTFFPRLNGQHLETRRKSQHGKDMPIDLTSFIRAGMNELEISFLRIDSERENLFYAVAVEIIQVAGQDRSRQSVQRRPFQECLDSITASLHAIAADDEIQVVDDHISIDITDPYTARVFEIPVRGNACLHRECFDLDTFFETRKTKRQDGPTLPDEWRCPICGSDARPQSLVIDEFLLHVRHSLEQTDSLETRAILVREDGSWEAKLQGSTNDQRIRPTPHTESKTAALRGADARIGSGVIDLDDD